MTFDRSILDVIEANLHALEIDEIKSRLEPLSKGVKIETPIFDPGVFLYRARKLSPTFNKQVGIKHGDLSYPPKRLVQLGRLNRIGQPVFYCSMHKESVFFELQGLETGDEVILTFWKTNQRMLVNNIGYTEYVFRQLGAKRAVPQWTPGSPDPGRNQTTIAPPEIRQEMIDIMMSQDANRDLREALSQYFMRPVGPEETDSYKLTNAIGEVHLGKIVNHELQFAGILYPSVRMWANGDNLAILPWFVDQHVEFRKALYIRIDQQEGKKIEITKLDSAKEIDPDGNLQWLGRLPNWTLQPGQQAKFVLKPDLDENGDYEISADGQPCHWSVTDAVTGHPITAL